jgi:hypothetical protein
MQIFVPTRGRIDRQVTREYACLDAVSKVFPVTYVIPKCDVDAWVKKYPSDTLLVVPDEHKFSDIRQTILYSGCITDPYHFVMDDDLYFYRREHGETTLRQANYEDIIEMFGWSEGAMMMDDYIHGGISPREGNNRVADDIAFNTRVTRCHFYNAVEVQKTGFDFRDVMCRQDFHFTLSMLERGFQNIVSYEWAHNQRGSGSIGGCSSYRTLEMMEAEAHKLKALHPEFVEVVVKDTKRAWGGGERKDVRCAWKKAYESSQN